MCVFTIMYIHYSKMHTTVATRENFEVFRDNYRCNSSSPFVKVSKKCHERLQNFPWW